MPGKKILLVDDHSTVRDLLRLLLEGEGYGISEAQDGAEALEKAKSERPDLVVLDLMMPQVDGEQVIKELWKSEGLVDLPVIVVSAKQEALDGCVEILGKENVFSKPFEPTKLLDRVEALIGRPDRTES